MSRRLSILLLAFATVSGATVWSGCYLSHGRGEDAAIGGRDAGIRDATFDALRDAGPDTGPRMLPDSGLAPTCRETWFAGGPVAITEEPGDEAILDVEWVREGYLVGYMSSNEAGDRSRFGRLTWPSRGVLAEPRVIFEPPAPVSGGMSIAVWRDQIGAVAWDERGCAFRRIVRPDAALVGGVVRYPTPRIERCDGLLADASGYSFVARAFASPTSGELSRLQPGGTFLSGQPLAVFDGEVFWWSRAILGENVMLLATMRGGVVPVDAVAQRVDSTGTPLGPVNRLPVFGAASRISVIGTPDGALMGWLESPDGDPDSQEREIRVFPTDPSGLTLAPPRALPGVRAYRDAGWSMTMVGDEIFVVYVEPEVGDRFGDVTALRAQRVGWDGTPIGAPLFLGEGRFLRHPLARTNGPDVFVAYTALAEVSHELYAVELRCGSDL